VQTLEIIQPIMPEHKDNILLIGMGAVGSIAAYALTCRGKSVVTCVVRSHYNLMVTKGLKIDSVDYGQVEGFSPDHVERTAGEAMEKYGPFDYVVIAMKNIPDVSPIEKIAAECYDDKTAFVLLQNGIGIDKPFFKRFPKAYLISGVSMIGAVLYGDTVKQMGPDFVTFGPFLNKELPEDLQIAKCRRFVDLYSNEHNDSRYVFNVKETRWKKLVYNSAMNTTCAVTGVDSGRLDLFGGSDSLVIPAMKEVIAIAKADGVIIEDSVIPYMLRGGGGVYYPPSMLVDIRKGNYTEYKTIIDNVVKIANSYKVPAPTLTVLCNILHIMQMSAMEKKGRFVLPKERPPREDHYEIKFID